jgi:ubiquitin carboxyl-terminal hydrolase 9/24
MEPYTVGGLAKIEGEAIDCDPSDLEGKAIRKYRLRGMVVHSGQVSIPSISILLRHFGR